MNEYYKFNINDNIYIKITDKELAKEHQSNYIKELDLYKFQAWEFANIFGKYCHIGFNPPVETNIYIAKEDLKEKQ